MDAKPNQSCPLCAPPMHVRQQPAAPFQPLAGAPRLSSIRLCSSLFPKRSVIKPVCVRVAQPGNRDRLYMADLLLA